MILTLLTIFASSFVIALSGALMPGPVLSVTVSESTRRGAVAGPLLILGHGLLELLLIVALLTGLAPLLLRDKVFAALSLIGGLTLGWMSWSMYRSLPEMRLEPEVSAAKRGNLVLAGIILSLANPYWLLWWATVGLSYIMISANSGIRGITAFFLGHILADLTWYSLISFGVARGRRFLSDGSYRLLIGVCALFMSGFSGYFLYSGIRGAI